MIHSFEIETAADVDKAVESLKSVKTELIKALWKTDQCHLKGCARRFAVRPSGKPRQYCTNSHRVMAHRKRKNEVVSQ